MVRVYHIGQLPARHLLFILGIVLVCARPASATPIALNVSGTLGNVETDRLTSPDAATSQGIVSGAAITGILEIDFDFDLTTLNYGGLNGTTPAFSSVGSVFLASLEFSIGDVSFGPSAVFQTMLLNEVAGTISFIFQAPNSVGSPPFLIDEVFMTLATGAPFNWENFSSIDPGSLQLTSWAGTKFGGDNQLAFNNTTNLEVTAVPEPSTVGYTVLALLFSARLRRSWARSV